MGNITSCAGKSTTTDEDTAPFARTGSAKSGKSGRSSSVRSSGSTKKTGSGTTAATQASSNATSASAVPSSYQTADPSQRHRYPQTSIQPHLSQTQQQQIGPDQSAVLNHYSIGNSSQKQSSAETSTAPLQSQLSQSQRQKRPDQSAAAAAPAAGVASNHYSNGYPNRNHLNHKTPTPNSGTSLSGYSRHSQDQQRAEEPVQNAAVSPAGLACVEFRATQVNVYMGNILSVNVDAVVSPSNQRLQNQGGAAGAIANAAGQSLLDECANFIRQYGQLSTTYVMHTRAGNLSDRFRYVMHVAGPRSQDYPSINDLNEVMRRTFNNCLQYANNKLQVKSICIPAIGSGTNGVPIEMVARTAYDAVVQFDQRLQSLRSPRTLCHVLFVNIDDVATRHFQQVFSVSPYNVKVTRDPAATQGRTSVKSPAANEMTAADDVDGAPGSTRVTSSSRRRTSRSDALGQYPVNGIHQKQRKSTSDLIRGSADKVITQDVIDVETYLWRYVQQYHAADFDQKCGKDVSYSYNNSSRKLYIDSISGKSIGHIGQSLRGLIQHLRSTIEDLECPMPQRVDEDAFRNIASSVVKRVECRSMFYIDQAARSYHIVGPKVTVGNLNSEIDQILGNNGTPPVHRDANRVVHFVTPGSITVQVYRQDLLLERVDAIVNPANVALQHGGGAARMIAKAAGSELQRECRDYINRNGNMKLTDVIHTTSGKLAPRILYVLHAAGPPASDFPNKNDLRRAVFKTFYNCMQYANDELQASSLSIPAISSGVYGAPVQLVADAAYDALMEFDGYIRSSRKRRSLREVHFVNIDQETSDVFMDTFEARQIKPILQDDTGVKYTTTERTGRSRYNDRVTSSAVDDLQRKSSSDRRTSSAPPKRKRSTMVATAQSVASSDTEDCVICMCPMTDPKRLDCGHKFCTDCINQMFDKCQPKCPSCGRLYGVMKGNQPPGTMKSKTIAQSLGGYGSCNTIVIDYDIPNGVQNDTHSNPGHPYYGTHRTGYLPDNAEGKEVLKLLKEAFDARLIFTVGRSNTDGRDNMVIWNDIHHKTSPTGPYGYPDPEYLKRVKAELAAKGIGVNLSKQTAI